MTLDRWVILADTFEKGGVWLRTNLEQMQLHQDGSWTLVRPWFDPTDFFEVRIITNLDSLMGSIYYEFMDIRGPLHAIHDDVKQFPLGKMVRYHLRDHPQGPSYQHPHPDPPFNQEEIDRGAYLRRRWIAPDPIYDPGEHDQHGMADERSGLASPEWLRRRR